MAEILRIERRKKGLENLQKKDFGLKFKKISKERSERGEEGVEGGAGAGAGGGGGGGIRH